MRCCPTTEELAAYQAGFVSAWVRAQLDTHVAACPPCQREMAALERTAHVLTQLSPPAMPQDLWPGVAQRLQARKRTQVWWRLAATAGMAASLLVGWLTWQGNQTAPLPAAPVASAQYIEDHQFLSAGDPLADRASLGMALASSRSEGE